MIAAVALGACRKEVRHAPMKLGASVLPLNPDYRPAELEYVIRDAAVSVVVMSGLLRG